MRGRQLVEPRGAGGPVRPVPRPAIPDAQAVKREVDAWRARRNIHNAMANWHFTTADARIKLKSLYPAP